MPSQVWQREAGVVPAGIRDRSEPEERDGDGFVLAYALPHRPNKIVLRDVLAAAGEEAMIGQSIEPGAGSSDY